MLRLLLLWSCLALAACSVGVVSSEESTGDPGTALPIVDSECNFATPLVPGIPGSPGHLIKSPRNPNGDSELAYMMRQCVDDLNEARELARAGKPVKKLYPTHRKIRCSWHTDPKERTEAFDLRAQSYLATVQAFDAAPTRANYNAILAACIACHSVSCPGPIDLIQKMRW